MHKARNRLRHCLVILALCLVNSGAPDWFFPSSQARAEGEAMLWMPIVERNYAWDWGSMRGRVTDAIVSDPNLAGLEGAEVCAAPGRCTTSDADGYYSLMVPPGYWTASSALDGYYDLTKNTSIRPTQEAFVNFAMSPEIVEGGNVELRLVLTWSHTPVWEDCPLDPVSCANDLDAHLWVDSLLDAHIEWPPDPEKCTEFPYACLEVDARYGSGPETIAFSEIYTDTPTIYYFGVFNYNQGRPGVPPLNQTNPHVDIYNENGLMMQLDPPTTGDGTFWYVFSMAAETGVISPTNCLANFDPNGVPVYSPVCP